MFGANLLSFPRQRTCAHESRASLPSTQKNMNIKKPWRELKIAKRSWKANDPSVKVNMAKSHVSPYMFIMLNMLISKRIVASLGLPSVLTLARWIFFLECLMSTLMTVTNITTLKAITASTGASRAPARTSTRLIKQLKVKKIRRYKSLSLIFLLSPSLPPSLPPSLSHSLSLSFSNQ